MNKHATGCPGGGYCWCGTSVSGKVRVFVAMVAGLIGGFVLATAPVARSSGSTPVVPGPGVPPYNSVGTAQLQDGGVTSPKLAVPSGPIVQSCGSSTQSCVATYNQGGQVLTATNATIAITPSAIACPIGQVPIGVDGGTSVCGFPYTMEGGPILIASLDGGGITITNNPGGPPLLSSGIGITNGASSAAGLSLLDESGNGISLVTDGGFTATAISADIATIGDGGLLKVEAQGIPNATLCLLAGSACVVADGQNIYMGANGLATINANGGVLIPQDAEIDGALRLGLSSVTPGRIFWRNNTDIGVAEMYANQNGSVNTVFDLPATNGIVGYPLITDGSGNTSWAILDIAGGGTGSATKNFVDLTTGQTVAGLKVWSDAATFQGSITAQGNPGLRVGIPSSENGTVSILNASGIGHASLTASRNAGTITTFDLPPTNGTANYPLTTDGSGNTSWALLPISGGGTGSATQNFVDLTTPQSVAGNKTWSGTATFSNISVSFGVPSTTSGTLTVFNSSGAGAALIEATNNAGTTTLFNLPPTNGTAGQCLNTDGSGNTSWGKTDDVCTLSTAGTCTATGFRSGCDCQATIHSTTAANIAADMGIGCLESSGTVTVQTGLASGVTTDVVGVHCQ